MLAEIAVANAAFAVIKEAVQNSGDLMSAGEALFKYFDATATVQKKANEKGGADKSDLEEFMALEQFKRQEAELKEMMIYLGRPGMYQDFLQFKVEARKKREAREKAALRRRQRIIDRIKDAFMIGLIVMLLGGIGVLIGVIIWYARDV